MLNRTPQVLCIRSTYIITALLAVFLSIICVTRQVGASSQSVTVGNAMLKIRPTDTPPTAISAEIHAAQNEFEAFQLVVTGPATGISVTAAALVGPNGSTIPGSEVRLYREGYQNITTPSNTEGGIGLWPDALIPDVDEVANEKRNAFPFDVPSGENRVVWVEVHVPQGQQPGTYQGSISVTGSGLAASVPVTLLVWDFVLPSTSSLPSTFGMGWSAECIAHYGSYNACGGDAGVEKMHVLYSRFMLDHRITSNVVYYGPTGCTGLNCDWTHFDATYGALFDGTDPKSRLQGAKQTTVLYVWNTTASSYYAGWAQHFRQKGWFDRTFDYTCDEPPGGCTWSSIPTRAAIVQGGDPSFRTLVTATIDDANTNGVTSSINILAPPVNFMNDKAGFGWPYPGNQRPNYDPFLQQNSNNRLWWYQSCLSHGCNVVGGAYFSGWPSFMIDNTASQNRAQGILSWLNNIGGVLYYSIDYQLANAWNSVYAFGGNGDGTLLYPGTPAVIGGTTDIPVASIRLKMIREGFEDYEYMKLVSDLGDPNFAQQTGQTLLPNIYESAQSPDAFYAAREALANRILTLKGSSQASTGSGSTSSGGSTSTTPPPVTVTRIEENAAAVTYTGTWFNNAGSFNSGGSAQLSMAANSSATLAFNGTGVSWIAYQDEWSGIADVYVDGALAAEVDTYASPGHAQAVVYTISSLANGAHTLAITATGRRNASSSGAWVWVDAFDVTSNGTSTSGSNTGSTTTATPITIFSPSSAPTAYSSSNPVELGVKFRSDAKGTVNGIRFYKTAGDTSIHTGSLWSSSGVLLTTGTFSGETSSGWQQLNFTTPVAITANTTYVVSYHSGGGFSYSYYFFGNSGVDNPPLHALQDGVDGPNGVYAEGFGGIFPTQSYEALNYWVDVVFAQNGVPGAGAPQSIVASSGTLQSSQVGKAFANALQVKVLDASSNPIPNVTVTFTAPASGASATLGGANAITVVTNASGIATSPVPIANGVSGTYLVTASISGLSSASFTLTNTNVVTIFSPSSAPPAYSSSNPLELGVKFRSDVNGTITGIRFYKGAGDTSIHTGSLWSSSGVLLATGTFSGETSSGWQQLNFTTPVAITANTTYVGSYHTGGGFNYSYYFFGNSGVDNPPLHALQDGVDGPNGVYAEGFGGIFPTQSYEAFNYWVDVVFAMQ